jgi:hypothetical protein
MRNTNECALANEGDPMISATRLANPTMTPANTQFHVRVQVRVNRLRLPYLQPVVFLTTRSGQRL